MDGHTAEAMGELLEREPALAALREAHESAARGSGRLVFVAGDAGIGKSALVRVFCASEAATHQLIGACDGLQTPRPLGPFVDIAVQAGGPFGEAVATDKTVQTVFDALIDELRARPVTIVVLEDVHWADEATYDMIRLLGRRVDQLNALVIATYRTDELPRSHPLRIVLGDVATSKSVTRVHLEPLSQGAVMTMVGSADLDANELYAKTSGNPFFVTEVLASGASEVPATIRDAVLARAARLSTSARDLLDAVAIVPQHTELWLLDAVAGDAAVALDECLAAGILRADERAVAFRHELARIAVEASLNPLRRVELHRAVLAALQSRGDGARDLARLAHHADAAGDGPAVLELAGAAGADASAVGAHREAAAQYARALRYAEALAPVDRAALLEKRSFESYLVSRHDDAIAALEEAIAIYRALGDARQEGRALGALAGRRWCRGDIPGTEEAVDESLVILERLGPSPELARAYAGASSLAMNMEKQQAAFAWSERAFELIDADRDPETFAYQLNNVGTMKLLLGRPEGRDDLERSIAIAEAHALEDHVGRAYIHLGYAGTRIRDFELLKLLDDGIEYCTDHGLDLWRLYVLASQARGLLDQGNWSASADLVTYILKQAYVPPLLSIMTLTTLATVRARRGDPEPDVPLADATQFAAGASDMQQVAPVAIARTEWASLIARPDLAAEASDAPLRLALECDAAWVVGELALWRSRAGIDEPMPAGVAEPYALHLSGDWSDAAECWERMGCPYEAALARGDADDSEQLHRALAELRELGAGPAASAAARRLRERGERGLARGPRPTTRQNPAGLTARELEVLTLVADGLQNSEIAGRLVVSRRTVDHHVSRILQKLDVQSRAQATREARRLQLVAER
jgi:DNA-binding CsgD family transcriptional regulator/tetratricopeptide (TPR) repeat protein